MKRPVVHDYFIGAVKDYTGLTINKKSLILNPFH